MLKDGEGFFEGFSSRVECVYVRRYTHAFRQKRTKSICNTNSQANCYSVYSVTISYILQQKQQQWCGNPIPQTPWEQSHSGGSER